MMRYPSYPKIDTEKNLPWYLGVLFGRIKHRPQTMNKCSCFGKRIISRDLHRTSVNTGPLNQTGPRTGADASPVRLRYTEFQPVTARSGTGSTRPGRNTV